MNAGGVPQFKMPGEDPDHPTYVGEIEGIILSEVTHSQRNSHNMYSLISGY